MIWLYLPYICCFVAFYAIRKFGIIKGTVLSFNTLSQIIAMMAKDGHIINRRD